MKIENIEDINKIITDYNSRPKIRAAKMARKNYHAALEIALSKTNTFQSGGFFLSQDRNGNPVLETYDSVQHRIHDLKTDVLDIYSESANRFLWTIADFIEEFERCTGVDLIPSFFKE